MFEIGGGQESGVAGGRFVKVVSHHVRSHINAWGGGFWMCGELRKFHDAVKVNSCVR